MALVLSRRTGETICIVHGATLIRVTITQIQGNQVKVSLDAPSEVMIVREELLQRPYHYGEGEI